MRPFSSLQKSRPLSTPPFVVHKGNCIETLKLYKDNEFDAVVADPPYGLSIHKPKDIREALTCWLAGKAYQHKSAGFMGRMWDAFVPGPEIWDEVYRVLKPGGWVLIFAGTRTMDLMTLALRLSGFEIRDGLGYANCGDLQPGGASLAAWVQGQGFPKNHNVSKAIDKEAGAERKVVGKTKGRGGANANILARPNGNDAADAKSCGAYSVGSKQTLVDIDVTTPATALARQWEGAGTALKPAWEPIILARKPLDGTLAHNVRVWGTGCLNIDGCRIGLSGGTSRSHQSAYPKTADGKEDRTHWARTGHAVIQKKTGRWPANVLHDGSENVMGHFPRKKGGVFQKGIKQGGLFKPSAGAPASDTYADSGSVARFFYHPKATVTDRDEGLDSRNAVKGHSNYGSIQQFSSNPARKNNHPTVKPTEVMRWLLRMVKHPSRTIKVLDPFMGSGSTGKAAMLEGGIHFTGIDLNEEFVEIAKDRCFAAWRKAKAQRQTRR